MLNAKFRKLIKDPNLFFSDMVKNKKRKMNSVYVKKEEGHYQYTIVSAVYNVGRYLDDFFKSIANQKLDFKKHIFIIMVDDGSQDNSAEIIQKWKNKYPDNIKYIWQENAGQSTARNAGLEHAETEWVTFIDPDDYLNLEYFSSIDNYLFDNIDKTVNLISCNIVMYLESKKIYRDNHPLNYKFSKGNNLVSISNADNEIQLSASSAFFRTSIIKNDEIFFDSRVKPNFEDAHFISKYLLNIEDGYILFMKDAEYLYRKREDGSSTLDTSWSKPERFTNVPEFGYLDTLKMYRNTYGSVPVNIQKTILYEALWYIKHLDNRPERTHFLSDSEKNFFIDKMKEIFSYIDNETIMKFNLAGIWFYHKMAMMSFFKNTIPGFQIAYVDRYDAAKELIRVRYFSNKSYYEQFLVDGEDSIPAYAKTTSHEFVGENLIEERWVWISIHQAKKIEIKLDNVTTSVSFGGKQYKGPVPISAIVESLQKQLPKFPGRRKYENSWVLMDRDMQADDNAEHLYRFIREHYPEQKIFFALRKESHDWERLRDDRFNLIDFDSSEHRLALGVCKKVISSHANYYVTNLLGPKMLLGRHFVFLQHGVTKDDISSWLNTKDAIDCFITASPYEYKSICEDNSKYNFSNKEVFLTGFPRHDNLINGANLKEKLIIIMPTWRSSIVGPVLGDGDSRGINPNFMGSTFAKHWKNLLHSNEFKALLERSGYKAVFFPHVNIKPYLELFDIPEYVDVITHTDGSIQELFIKSSIMITDYSSVAFEMAIQNKQTIYYQFDEEEFFSGHNYIKGYFDYRRNGFGPVVTTQESLINELSRSLSNNCVPDAETLYRINDMFPVRDNQNCARTFEAIKSLDDGSLNREIELCNLKKSALKATEHFKWNDAEIRWNKYIDITIDIISNAERFESIDYYFQALSEQGKHSYLDSIIDSYLPDARESLSILEKYASLMSSFGLWHSAEVRWERYLDICTEVNSCAVFNYLESIRKQGRLLEVEQMIDGLLINNSDQDLQQSVREAKALLLMSRHMWKEAINEWTSIGKNKVDNLKYCECLAYDFQYLELDYFLEKEMSDFISPSIINVFSLYAYQNWEGVIKILSGDEFDLQDDESLAARLLLMKSHAYRYIDDEENAHKCLVRYESSVKNDPQCRYEIASLAFKNEKWSKVIAQISKVCTDLVMLPKEFKLMYLNSLFFLNSYKKMEEAFSLLSYDCQYDIDIIRLRTKMFIFTSRWEDAFDALLQLDQDIQESIIKEYLFDLTEYGKHSRVDDIIKSYLDVNKNVSGSFIEDLALSATSLKIWNSAEYRWSIYLEHIDGESCLAVFNYLEAIRVQGRLWEVEQLIDGFLINGDKELQQSLYEEKALLLMSRHMWNEAISEWSSIDKNKVDNLKYCECLAYNFQHLELDHFLENEMNDFISPSIINVFSLYAHQDWEGVIKFLSGEEFDLQDDESLAARLLLMKSHAYLHIEDEENAHKCLVRYESSVKNDPQCRYEIARLAFKNEKWAKAIAQISKSCIDPVMLPKEFKLIYLNSLLSLNSYEKVEDVFTALSSDCLFDIDIILLRVKNLILTERWQEACEALLLLEQDTQEDIINQYLSELTECEKHSKVDDIIKNYLDVNKQISSVFIEGLALSASSLMIWSSAEYRWSVYLELFDGENCLAVFNYLEAIRKQKRYIDLDNKIRELSITHDTSLQKCILEIQALLYMSKHMWPEAINTWRILGKDSVDNIKYCECLSYCYCCDELDYFVKTKETADLNIKVFAAYARKKWDEVIILLNLDSDELQNERNIMSKMLLIKSAAYRNLGEFDFAYKCLFLYEEKVKDDAQCRFEIARVAFAAKQWKKVITQLDKASPELSSLPMEFNGIYLQSLYSLRLFSKMEATFEIFSDDLLSDELMMKLKADMYMSLEKWNNALSILNLLGNDDSEVVYAKSLSLKNLGDFEAAFEALTKSKPIDTMAAWNLRLELAQLNDNWEDAYKCSLRVKWKKDGVINITSDNIEHLVMLKS